MSASPPKSGASGRSRASPPADTARALAFADAGARLAACSLPRSGRAVACGLRRRPGIPGDVATRLLTPVALPEGLAGRGVLLDLPRAERRPGLPGGEAIEPARLDEAAERLGVTVEAGDLLLVRTGALGEARSRGAWPDYRGGALPGLSRSCAAWLLRRRLSLAASDTPRLEVAPAEAPGEEPAPLRRAAHDAGGLLLGFDFDLEPLARSCAQDGNYAFLLVIAPLAAPGVHPVSPLALK